MTLSKSELKKMYFDEEKSFYKIEAETGIPVNSIRYWFKKWEFKARTHSEAQRGVLNHSYKDGINNNRFRAYLRDNKKCVLCGYDRVVQIHHIIQRSKGGSEKLSNLITLCPNCHRLVHDGIIKIKSLTEIIDSGKKHERYKN